MTLVPIRTTERLITGPTQEPLDLDETKKALRFLSSSEDTLIDQWISAARHHFELETDRQIMTATWELRLDAFPVGPIELPKPPLQSVTSVIYVDSAGDEQTLVEDTDYIVDVPVGPQAARGLVSLPALGTWPTPITEPGCVRVRFLAGYGDVPGDVPEIVKAILWTLIGEFFKYGRAVSYETRFGQPSSVTERWDRIIQGFKLTALPVHPPMQTDLLTNTIWV